MRSHPGACKKMIEVLLHLKVKKLKLISEEETIFLDRDARSIRLDLYVKNDKDVFAIEVQVIDTKKLPERARHYQNEQIASTTDFSLEQTQTLKEKL